MSILVLESTVSPSTLDDLRTDANTYFIAYQALKAEIAAVPDSDLEPINLDVSAATTTALGALRAIRSLRPAIVSTLGDFDIRHVDKLEDYASALIYLHMGFVHSTQPPTDLPALVEQAGRLRDAFVDDAQALVTRGLLDPSVLSDRPRGPGYRQLAMELLALTCRLRAAWPQIAGRSAIDESEIATAEAICKYIQSTVGQREQTGPTPTPALSVERQRAYTLFLRAYDEVRRAAVYLRWHHDDADTLVPSLYAGRGGRKRTDPPAQPAESSQDAQGNASLRMPSGASSNAAHASSGPAAQPNRVGGRPGVDAPVLPAFDPNDPENDPFAAS